MQVVKPREGYVMVIDADSILRKPFIPEELHLELGASHWYPTVSQYGVSALLMRGCQPCNVPPQWAVPRPREMLQHRAQGAKPVQDTRVSL